MPLVLLHPFPLDGSFWDDLLTELPVDRPRSAPDVPGFGSAPLRDGAGIVDVADGISSEIDRLGGHAVIVGCSMGGFIALSVAVRRPEQVAGLILTGTGAAADPPERREERDASIERIRAEGSDGFLAEFLPPLMAAGAAASVRDRVRSIAARASPEALVVAIEALRDRPDRSDDLAGIDAPTLVIAGADDGRTPPEAMRRMADEIPGARFVSVPGAGHLAPIETPAAVAEHITAFLGSLAPDPPPDLAA